MLALMGRRPVTISVLARSVNVSVGVGSLYVRALETYGLVRTRRRGAWIECWPVSPRPAEVLHGLLNALNTRLQADKKAVRAVFRLATAFTHPRRVELYLALRGKPQTLAELKASLGIPGRALLRHLQKLHSRGFLTVLGTRPRRYAICKHPDPFARALALFVTAK